MQNKGITLKEFFLKGKSINIEIFRYPFIIKDSLLEVFGFK